MPHLQALDELGYEQTVAELGRVVASRMVVRPRRFYRLSPGWDLWFRSLDEDATATASAPMGTAAEASEVEVVDQGRVGAYDTAILRAAEPKALLGWLKTHGFESDARLEGWLRPYTEKGWAITAFRFAPHGSAFTSEPVESSFHADRPFYPYREPATTNAPASRSLRVYLVAPGRQAGKLEGGPWPTPAEYAGPMPEAWGPEIATNLGLPDHALQGLWLTSFLDRRTVRPDSELFFEPNTAQNPVEPPPVIHWRDEPVEVPKGLVAMGIGGPLALSGVLLVRRRRRV